MIKKNALKIESDQAKQDIQVLEKNRAELKARKESVFKDVKT